VTTRFALPWPHVILALAVVAVWGTNFVVIKFALAHLPPLTLAALRFASVVFPAIFFFRRPRVSWRNLAAYGLFIGAGQFGLLFLAMKGHISPGLASLVVQMQVFFTIGLSMRLTGEQVRPYQIAALGLAGVGIAVILTHTTGDATPLGVALVLGAAASWAGGNTVSRAAGPVNMLAYVVWSSLFAVPPLLVLALVVEGWPAMRDGIAAADAATWLAVAWQAVGNSLFGYAAWGWLLSRHPAATITPMALLIPVFGMGASALALGEGLPAWKLVAAGLVMSGLAVNLCWPIIRRAFRTAH
jgi:O-acetylserine/cysteine efflux transporter